MDLNFDDATLELQAEVRDFLAANKESFPTKSYDTAEGFEQHRRWDKVLFDAGLSVITRLPSSRRRPTSPVCNQPSGSIAAAVCSGSSR